MDKMSNALVRDRQKQARGRHRIPRRLPRRVPQAVRNVILTQVGVPPAAPPARVERRKLKRIKDHLLRRLLAPVLHIHPVADHVSDQKHLSRVLRLRQDRTGGPQNFSSLSATQALCAAVGNPFRVC
jgi:hypothetical protein